MLVCSAGDLVLLFLGLELISIPTYILIFLGRRDRASHEATTKYFFLSILSSALLLYGLSFFYGIAGSTDLETIRLRLSGLESGGLASLLPLGVLFIFAGLAFKIAAVPFHFYAPDVYEGTTAGNAGVLIARVIYVKQGADKPFVIVDAAMNDLIRPTLYEAHHDIKPVVEASPDTPRIVADVVGPVCETGDYLALSRDMPAIKAGDLIAIMTAGAYGAVQASTYNTRPLVPEVLVRGHDHAVVRPRPTYDELIGLDRIPAWLD